MSLLARPEDYAREAKGKSKQRLYMKKPKLRPQDKTKRCTGKLPNGTRCPRPGKPTPIGGSQVRILCSVCASGPSRRNEDHAVVFLRASSLQ